MHSHAQMISYKIWEIQTLTGLQVVHLSDKGAAEPYFKKILKKLKETEFFSLHEFLPEKFGTAEHSTVFDAPVWQYDSNL